jgi:hypothetical protein
MGCDTIENAADRVLSVDIESKKPSQTITSKRMEANPRSARKEKGREG